MDLHRLRVGEWIAAISGVVLLISLFLPWWSVPGQFQMQMLRGGGYEGTYFERSLGTSGSDSFTSWSAWEMLSTTDILLGLLGAAAIVLWIVTARARNTAPGIAFDALLVPFALVMSIVCLIRVLNVPEPLEPLADALDVVDVEYGAWLGLAATLGVLAGVLVAMRDERLSKPGQPTDQTGMPVDAPPAIEKLPAPPSA
jgi:hypothetical protein